jgi:Uma2 family endonuclease
MGLPREDWFNRHRYSVEDYYRMEAAGMLAPDSRVELIDGEVIDMAPIGPMHAGTVGLLARRLADALGGRFDIRVQQPLRIGDHSEPQPDIAVVLPDADAYRRRHPAAGDVLLVVEVAETSLRFDRDVKMALYAAAGISRAWLADLANRQIISLSDPSGGRYASTAELTTTARVAETDVDLGGIL